MSVAEPLPCNACFILAYFAVATQQRIYVPQCETIILHIALHLCKALSVVLMEEIVLRIYENIILRRIFRCKEQ
jgi:hypothetical protein